MDLFREILLAIEEQPNGKPWTAKPLMEHSIQDVVGHLRLVHDAGLVEARFIGPMNNDTAFVIRMTNDGYDFLEASKKPTLWEQAKEKLKTSGLPLTAYGLKQVLDALIRARLGH